MTTNRDWLFSLPLEEQYAWMNAEHVQQPVTDASERVTNQAEMLDDSRERLEADVRELMRNLYEIGYTDAKINHGILNDEVAAPLFSFDEKRGAKFIELLDRQAAITEREYVERMASEAMCSRICVVVSEQREQIAELTAERDNLADDLLIANKQREYYRDLFGKCLDYADAIHALMDEGMA